jgi:hypothetical protein
MEFIREYRYRVDVSLLITKESVGFTCIYGKNSDLATYEGGWKFTWNFFYTKDVCTRAMKRSLWQMEEPCSHSLTRNCTICAFALEAVQDGVSPCHSECRTVLCYQTSGERETGSSWNMGKILYHVQVCMIGAASFLKAVNRSLTDHMLTYSHWPSQIWTFVTFRSWFGKQSNYSVLLHPECS